MKINNNEQNYERQKQTARNIDSKSKNLNQGGLKVCDINKNINNNNKINNSIKNNTLLAETSFCEVSTKSSFSSLSSSLHDSCNHDTCEHDSCLNDSTDTLTFSNNFNKHDSHGENVGETDVEKHTPCRTEECTNDVESLFNKVKVYEEEIKEISEHCFHNKETKVLIEDRTQELERYKAILKEQEEILKERKRKENERIKWEKRIHSKIDIDYSDNEEIKKRFKLFISNLRELGFKTTYNTYTKYSQQLNKYKTQEEKLKAFTIAICWGTPTLQFNLNKDTNQRKKRYKNKQKNK